MTSELKVNERGLPAFNIGPPGLIAIDLTGNTTLSFTRQGGSLYTAGTLATDPAQVCTTHLHRTCGDESGDK